MTIFIRATLVLFSLCFAVTVMAEFPTSSVSPTGTWETMHEDGYTGSLEDTCPLLNLSEDECMSFWTQHSNGDCGQMIVPNGVVMDSMVFTKNGVHQVQRNLEVKLHNPPSRNAQVCSVGNKAVIYFSGCRNVAVVNSWSIREKFVYQRRGPNQARDPYANVEGCPGGDPERRYFAMAMYAPEAATDECALEHMLPYQGRLVDTGGPIAWGNMDAFSVSCGQIFHEAERVGEIVLGTLEHEVEIVIIDGDEEWLLFKGTVKGDDLDPVLGSPDDAAVMAEDQKSIFIPEVFQSGLVAVHFLDYTHVRTPARSGVAYPVSEFQRDCHLMRYTGIEMSVHPQSTAAMVVEEVPTSE